MKGLILKDLLILKGYGKQYGLIFGFFLIWSIMMKSFSFMSCYLVLLGGMMVMSTMNSDESVSFNRFVLTTPIGVKKLIGEKYILFLLTLFGGAGIGMLPNMLSYASPVGTYDYFEWGGLVAIVSVFMMVYAINFPVMFKYGVEKARNIYVICVILAGGIIWGSIFLSEKLGISLEEMDHRSGGGSVFLLTIAASALLLSYFVSVKAVENKEW